MEGSVRFWLFVNTLGPLFPLLRLVALPHTLLFLFHPSLQYINTTLSLVGPMITIVLTHPPPVLSAMVMIQSAIVWMKLVSYVDVNKVYAKDVMDRLG